MEKEEMRENYPQLAQAAEEGKILEYVQENYGADPEDEEPAVYVGTYHKYNCGSIYGAWVSIDKCYDYEEFRAVCEALHHDEEEPELMFQDYENFPQDWYSESGIDEEVFDKIKEFAALDEDKKRALEAYMDYEGDTGIDLDEFFDEVLVGEYDSEEDFAYELVQECYCLELKEMGNLAYYFDYAKFARDLFMGDYTYYDGFVFRCV